MHTRAVEPQLFPVKMFERGSASVRLLAVSGGSCGLQGPKVVNFPTASYCTFPCIHLARNMGSQGDCRRPYHSEAYHTGSCVPFVVLRAWRCSGAEVIAVD